MLVKYLDENQINQDFKIQTNNWGNSLKVSLVLIENDMETLKEIVLPVLICLSIGWVLSKIIVFFVGYPTMTQWATG